MMFVDFSQFDKIKVDIEGQGGKYFEVERKDFLWIFENKYQENNMELNIQLAQI